MLLTLINSIQCLNIILNLILNLKIYLFSPDEVPEGGRKASDIFFMSILLILIKLRSIKSYSVFLFGFSTLEKIVKNGCKQKMCF